MLLALLSDTHDNVPATQAALEMLASHHPDVYLHAGDLVSPDMLPLFAGLDFHFVFGNNEYDFEGLRSLAVSLGLHCHEQFAELAFGAKRVALLHGHDQSMVNRFLRSSVDYLIHGHTHERRDERHNATRIINPGAVHRARVRSVALLELETDAVTFLEIPRLR
jgi:hypothetical protein